MLVLGISEQHDSHACLIKDGNLIGCIAEERLSRIKSDSGFPRLAIESLMNYCNVNYKNIDFVAFSSSSKNIWHNVVKKHALFEVKDWIDECEEFWKPVLLEGNSNLSRFIFFNNFINKNNFNFKNDLYYDLYQKVQKINPSKWEKIGWETRTKTLSDLYNINIEKCSEYRHEDCHKIYGYYSSPFVGKEALIFTLEGGGDDSSATVSIANEKGEIKETWSSNDVMIGRLYAYVTLILGMKPGQHEYKVMGLAPYGSEKYAKPIIEIFRKLNYVDGEKIKNTKHFKDLYFSMMSKLRYFRFDNIAFALQKYLEDTVIDWVNNNKNLYGINNIIFTGGVGQNIKLAKSLGDVFGYDKIWHPPISGDGSLGIGAAWLKTKQENFKPKGFNTIYLGKDYRKSDIELALKNLDKKNFLVKYNVGYSSIAKFLADGKICARFSERMEFGQRALGNRSILADPRNFTNVEKINNKIKYRDFWMPFTPTILDTEAPKILRNFQGVESPFMTIAFDLKEEFIEKIPAVIHPSDKTIRPQILCRKDNEKYYDLILSLKQITGLGIILNTSFNLHGEPIVESPKDALATFEKSDLDILIFDEICVFRKSSFNNEI